MWRLFRKKKKDPVKDFHITYRIVYRLSNGRIISTDPINITIPAISEDEANRKLKRFVLGKVQIKIL